MDRKLPLGEAQPSRPGWTSSARWHQASSGDAAVQVINGGDGLCPGTFK